MMTNDLMLGESLHPDGDDARSWFIDGASRADPRRSSRSRSRGSLFLLQALCFSRFATILAISRSVSRLKRSEPRSASAVKREFRWHWTDISGSMRQLNGSDVRFLVDSGATMTTIDRKTATDAGDQTFRPGPTSSFVPETGSSAFRRAEPSTLNVGTIEKERRWTSDR